VRRIGVDVGGTNTDAVLVSGREVRHAVKAPTTPDVTTGITNALRALIDATGVADVDLIALGTTHFTNAVAAVQQLAPAAAVRLGYPASAGLPPFVDWPQPLRDAIGGTYFLCGGGHEYDGRPISQVDKEELLRVAEEIRRAGIRSVAVSSVFSMVNPEAEREAAAVLADVIPDGFVSLSHEIGRVGLLERENATILNAALRPLARHVVGAVREALTTLALRTPLFFTQNDGTLMSVGHAEMFPVWTIASGPTNSMRGAAFLSALDDCAVVDIGGTTTDIGILKGGFPREASTTVNVGGVRTNFRMPDVVSLPIGGGSLVTEDDNGAVTVGPASLGYELHSRGRAFGGDVLTASDLAIIEGRASFGAGLTPSGDERRTARLGLASIEARVAAAIDRMKTDASDVPVVVVGGGSVLLPESLTGASVLVRPDHFAVANAVGAAIAQVGGVADRVFSLTEDSRESALSRAKQDAIDRAVEAGARRETVTVADVDEVTLGYLPGSAVRIRVKAVGEVDVSRARAEGREG